MSREGTAAQGNDGRAGSKRGDFQVQVEQQDDGTVQVGPVAHTKTPDTAEDKQRLNNWTKDTHLLREQAHEGLMCQSVRL